jgi:hypothetical protein
MRMMLFIPLILMLVAAGGQDENAAYNFVDQDGLFKAVKKTGGEKAYTPYDSFSIIISQGDKRFVIDNNDYEVRLESSPFKIICVLEDNQVIRLNISENDNVFDGALTAETLLHEVMSYSGYFGFAETPLNPDTSLCISENNPPYLWNVWAMDGKNPQESRFDEITSIGNKYHCVRTVTRINNSFKNETPIQEYRDKTLYVVAADIREVYDETKKYKTVGDWIKSADFYLIKTLRFKIRFDGNP